MYSIVISDGTCGYVEGLIQHYFENFKSLFTESHLIPKHHYLLEIPQLILLFGPAVRWCCMRFEALHKVFKSFVSVVSFQSLCLSLSNKYLKHTCDESAESHEHVIFQSARVDGAGHTYTVGISPKRYIENRVNFPDYRRKMCSCSMC